MESLQERIHLLLEGIDFTKSRQFDYHISHVWPINGNGLLKNLIKDDDSKRIIQLKQQIAQRDEEYVHLCEMNGFTEQMSNEFLKKTQQLKDDVKLLEEEIADFS